MLKYLVIVFVILPFVLMAQQPGAMVKGRVFDTKGLPLHNVRVETEDNDAAEYSDSFGHYKIPVKLKTQLTLIFVKSGYKASTLLVPSLNEGEVYTRNIYLVKNEIITDTIGIKGSRDEEPFSMTLKPREFEAMPSVNSSIESLIKTLPGVSSGNELSSQYNVRGGSFDENLVYVNDIEIYRPQLVRSGQQEGLSFINPDLVSNLSFSAGGFETRYGDKLSSVLDVTYKKPQRFGSGAQVGLLGGSFYVEGIARVKNKPKLTYLFGGRYRGNKNILNSLDVQGLYKSRFYDFQSLVTYGFTRSWRLEWLTNVAQNSYLIKPEKQETSFGTVQNALKLTIFFEGQEIMHYNSGMTALSLVHTPNKRTELKWIASGFVSNESEHYDVQGAYSIDQLDNNQGSGQFGQSKNTLGVGYFINHARNDLYYTVYNLSHQGWHKGKRKGSKLTWGVKYQAEHITDRFKEWKYSDSSEYNISPFGQSVDSVLLSEYISSKTNLFNQRISGFLQNQHILSDSFNVSLNYGVRINNSALNGQTVVSPRAQILFEPNKRYNIRVSDPAKLKKDITLRLAFGYYYQPPFYREMRNFQGYVNTGLKAQRSIHFVGGSEWTFKSWDRPFKFFSEVYYKKLDYLVPYLLDNIRIRYYGDNTARGYATGFDSRINGEFIKGLESWFTLSFLKTDEKIKYVNTSGTEVETGFLRRPTDRRVSAAIMFQDELPSNPNCRMNLNLVFGSGMPYYLGGTARYKEGNTIPAYKRVDIGFSYVLIKDHANSKDGKLKASDLRAKKHGIQSLWVGADVFNLLQINNVVSYIWVKDFQNNVYGVPNYLTARRLNLRLSVRFN